MKRRQRDRREEETDRELPRGRGRQEESRRRARERRIHFLSSPSPSAQIFVLPCEPFLVFCDAPPSQPWIDPFSSIHCRWPRGWGDHLKSRWGRREVGRSGADADGSSSYLQIESIPLLLRAIRRREAGCVVHHRDMMGGREAGGRPGTRQKRALACPKLYYSASASSRLAGPLYWSASSSALLPLSAPVPLSADKTA